MTTSRITPPSWPDCRALFPAVQKRAFLNTAGGSTLPLPAASAAKRYYAEMHTDGDIHWDRWLDQTENVRVQLAETLRCQPRELAFLSNASHGLNMIAHLFPVKGRVLIPDCEFPSVSLPWLRRGFAVDFVEPGPAGVLDCERFERAALADTRLLVISSVQYATGFRADLNAIGEWCRAREIALVVDATQEFGAFPIDVRHAGIAAMVFSGYKWATAGYGIAPLFIRHDLTQEYGLPAAGWRSAATPYALVNDRLDQVDSAHGLELGHPPFPGVFALGASLELVARIGLERIGERIMYLKSCLRERLAEAGWPCEPRSAGTSASGITMLRVDAPERTVRALELRDVLVSARGVGLRLSLHYYNNEEDIERLVEALATIRKAAPGAST